MSDERFMRERPVFPLLCTMALPMVVSMAVNALYNIVDSFFVAKISEDALTALSLVYPMQNFVNAVAIGFGVGMNAVISYYLGAGDRRRADEAATQATLLSVLHGAVLMVVCLCTIPAFLGLYTQNGQVLAMGTMYGRIVFSFAIVIMLNLSFEKLFQAVGRMNVSMVGLLIGAGSNILLDPLMIWGIGPFPKLGIAGAALATGTGQTLTLIYYICVYVARPTTVRLRKKCIHLQGALCRKLYSVGIPAILNLALASLLISAMNAILSAYAQSYVLVLGVYYKLQTFLYLPANGIIQGMRPVIGYNYGAGEQGRVKRIYLTTLAMTAVIMALGTLVCLTASGGLIGLFTDNPDTILVGTHALRIICCGFIVSAVSVTSAGALEGLSMGTRSLCITLLRYVVVILPVAFLLTRFSGPDSVWHAFWITELCAAAASLLVCRRAVFRPAGQKQA